MPLYPDFERTYPTDAPAGTQEDSPRRWIAYRGHDVLVNTTTDAITLLPDTPPVRALLAPPAVLTLGALDGITYLTCEIAPDAELPPDWQALDLRALYGQLSEPEWQIAGYAAQILHWQRVSRFCPVCGQATEPLRREWLRHCAHCGHDRYPQVSPAVLILVHDGADGILLAHKPGWGDRYSILAGFVLPGESLEDCVRRETEEETGVPVGELMYQGSQPWPFPHQLMIGFRARRADDWRGDIRLDAEELDHAAWFDVRALPALPPPLSLSRQMIDAWQRERLQLQEGESLA